MPALDPAWITKGMQVVYYLGQLSLLLPICMGYQRRKALSLPLRLIWWCCIMWASLTILAESLRLSGHYNVLVWNAVTVLETACIGRALYLMLHSARAMSFLRYATLFLSTVAIIENIYAATAYINTIYTNALSGTLLVVLVLLYFQQTLRELQILVLESEPMFLIAAGVLIYFSTTTVFFLFERGFPTIDYHIMMTANAIMCIIFYSIITRAFWLVGQVRPKPVIRSVAARK